MADDDLNQITGSQGRVPYRFSLNRVYRRVNQAIQSINWMRDCREAFEVRSRGAYTHYC